MVIKDGDKVVVSYVGKFESGEIFDASEKHGKPLEFEVGAKMVVPGFDNAIKGMEKGKKKSFEISPAEGYGELNPALVQQVPKSALPQDQEPQVGMVLMIASPEGQQFPARITEVKDDSISIDLNHPLAGKKLLFDIEIVDVISKE